VNLDAPARPAATHWLPGVDLDASRPLARRFRIGFMARTLAQLVFVTIGGLSVQAAEFRLESVAW
jgi:hypothetical protein